MSTAKKSSTTKKPSPPKPETTAAEPSSQPSPNESAASGSSEEQLREAAARDLSAAVGEDYQEQPEPGDPGEDYEAGPSRNPADYQQEAVMLTAASLKGVSVIIGLAYQVEISFQQSTIEAGAGKVAPVLAKHGGVMPAWMERYREEFEAGAWFAGAIFQAVIKAKQLQAEAEEQAKHAHQNQEGSTGTGSTQAGAAGAA